MLPSSGYFRGITCPGQLRGACTRPYCHFRHDVKDQNVSSSSSQAAVPTPVQEEAEEEEEEKQEELELQIMSQELSESSSASLPPSISTPSEAHTSHQQEPVTAPDEVPKSEILQQLMSEALKKVLAENPTLASTVDASSIRIGIDPVTQESPELNKTKKQLYHRPPDTPSYNPTPIRELKKRKQSVDGVHNLPYNPTYSTVTADKGSGDEGGMLGEFSSDESEEVEEKNDDFDLLEEVLAEHSKNNKVKVRKKKVKELGKLQYSLSNTHKKTVDNSIMITDAKKLSDKEVKRFELPQSESVNKIITDGPYFLPPSPIFTSSSDGFEAFSARASHQEEEVSVVEECLETPPSHVESVKTYSHSASEKKNTLKLTPELSKSSSKSENKEKVTKASGHTHLPQLLSARDPPKLSRPNIRTWTPLVRNNIQSSETQKSNDQLDEILQLMDGSEPSNKMQLKETEPQTSNQRDSETARPKKKYKVDLNKEIESLSNPALEHSKESATPDEELTNQLPEPDDDDDEEDSDKETSTKEHTTPERKEKEVTKKPSTKDSEEKEQSDESEAASTAESEESEDNSLSEESDEDSEYKRSRHRKKRKRKRSRSTSSDSDYSRHRRKKRKRSHKRHRKRNKRSRKRRDCTSSVSDESQQSEEEREEKKDNDDDEEEEEEEDENDVEEEDEEGDEGEEKENKSKEDSESEDEEDSDGDMKKSKKYRKKHKHYKKLKHKKNRHKARRKRKRSKSYSRSRSTGKSRDSSASGSGSRSRSGSKHKKKRNRSRHRSRNYSDSENRDSIKETSRSRSSSRSSSKHKKRRESREDDSSGSRHREPSKSKDKRVDEEGGKVRKEDQRRRRDRSTSKSEQQASDDKKSKNHNEEEISIPMPIDPSKIKVEKNTLVPDLSKVKIEKEDPVPEKSNGQVSVSVKPKENSSKRQSESSQHKVAGKIHEPRSSTEDKNRRKSHERKDSTESTSDKPPPHRRHSCESKASDNESSLQRKKTEERRSSNDKNKKTPSISSQPSEMSMFDLVLASAGTPKPTKTLTEISMFDSVAKASTNHLLEPSKLTQHVTKNKSKDASHKSSGENTTTSEHKSSSSDKTSKSSRSEKTPHTDSHHKHSKSDTKSSHSSSKSKSSSSSSHQSSSSSSHQSSSSSHQSSSSNHQSSSSSSHKRTSSTSSRGSTSKHHSTSTTPTTIPTPTTTAATTTTSSSSKTSEGSSSSSSRSKKSSDPTNSKSEKESSRHTSTSSRRHSSSSNNKHHDSTNSRRSSSSSKHKDSKESTKEATKNTKKKTVSADEDSHGGVSDDMSSGGGESPLPDLSMLDEISQDDWEQMISGLDGANANQEGHEDTDGDEVDTDNPWVLEECMKMFNEFQAEENHLDNQVLPKKVKVSSEEKEPPKSSTKQRVARSSTTGNLVPKKSSKSRHQKTTPMQMMVERYQKLKEQLKMKDKQLHHLQGGPSSVSSSSSTKISVSSSSSSSTHHNSSSSQSSSGKSKKRIAHVPNVNSLLTAHEKIKKTHSSPSTQISARVAKASGVIPETTAHTVAKGAKRLAHTPKLGALARPIIQPELGTLVPQNIRQRYLNALIDECKKFASEKDSFNIAAAEERVCYKRAPSRSVYLNLVVNAVKRLRTQQEAGEEAQELLDKDPQLAEKMCIEECNASTVKPSPASSPSPSRPHPINPNHVQLSHTSVLTAGGFKGSWSIEKPKKASACQEALRGYTFYKNLSKYILTEEQLGDNGYPCPDPDEKGKAMVKKIDTRKKISPSALERYCGRCSVLYTVDKWGFPKNSAPCIYHWGRAYKKRKYGTFETSYSCCGGERGSGGCGQATTHVSENYNPKNLRGYVRTISKDSSTSNKEVYALDCEMCYTTEGNELTRITVINSNGDVVYEQLVKPENPILDYNTRFSGITESDMEDVKITIRDVQAALLGRFSDKTILIGHSLESDLHALKIIHATVVDTSVVFPHKMGAPFKRALKNLAAEYLKRIIQDDVSGHDSAEDAVSALHLMQWKVKEDLKGFSK